MNIFDEAKLEIRELVRLTKVIERYDTVLMHASIKPTPFAIKKRIDNEKKYTKLLKKYT
jgi:hypothetical protein